MTSFPFNLKELIYLFWEQIAAITLIHASDSLAIQAKVSCRWQLQGEDAIMSFCGIEEHQIDFADNWQIVFGNCSDAFCI